MTIDTVRMMIRLQETVWHLRAAIEKLTELGYDQLAYEIGEALYGLEIELEQRRGRRS